MTEIFIIHASLTSLSSFRITFIIVSSSSPWSEMMLLGNALPNKLLHAIDILIPFAYFVPSIKTLNDQQFVSDLISFQ